MKKKIVFTIIGLVSLLLLMFIAGNINAPSTNLQAKEHAEAALKYCKANGLRTDYCILVDFSVYPGKNRFFIWDFNKQDIVYSTICEHGRGGKSTLLKPEFSNRPGSKCSSLGKYQIMNDSHMNSHPNIPCYILKGVDATNNNAFRRYIYIHPDVSQITTFPFPLPWMTEGCFGIPYRGFDKVKHYRKMSNKPMLLWAY